MVWGTRLRAIFAPLLAFVAFAPPVCAQAASESATSEAVVLTPLSFIKTADLNFGQIAPGPTAGTVVLSPNGAVAITGGVRLAVGSPNAAHFAGYGALGQFVRINLDANSYTLSRLGGGASMQMRNLLINSAPPTILGTNRRWFRIGSTTGVFNFDLGATLDVGADQASGKYEGTFEITLEYF